MESRDFVSVCIPTRNQAEFIAGALSSAFSQTLPPCEVVISDDAGVDETAAVVRKFANGLAPRPRSLLRYHRSSHALGIGGNFDHAVRLTKGQFVVKLDSDDLLEPDFIERLWQLLKSNPTAGWAHCNVLNVWPTGVPIGLAHTHKRTGFYSASAALPRYLRHNDTCHCVMLRRAAYEAVGGYRPEMKTCEDWLLWLEMLFAGWGYCFDERPLARMRKYKARPELMSKRRLDFAASLKFMVPRVEIKCRSAGLGLGLPSKVAVATFRDAAARLCISSGCDEAEPGVRNALFDIAYSISPSPKNWVWCTVGPRLPAQATRIGTRAAGMPRNLARFLVQRLRHVSPAAVP